MSGAKLGAIQWLRGAAALLVVVDHALFTAIDRAGVDPSLGPLASHLGETGVKLFFLISGLVMVLSSTGSFGPAAAAGFVRRRLLRIVPLYWIATTVYLVKLMLAGSTPPSLDILRSYLFVPYLGADGEMQPILGLGWTLEYELFFYALFAAGLLFSLRATLLGTSAVLAGAVVLGAGLTVHAVTPMPEQWLFVWSRPIVLFFAAGMLVAWWLKTRSGRNATLRVPQGAAIALASCWIGCTLWLERDLLPGTAADLGWLVVPVLVLGMSADDRPTGWLSRLSISIGEASYSIYLTHAFVVGPIGRSYARFGLSGAYLLPYLVLCLVAATVLGLACHRWIERPSLRWLGARLLPSPVTAVTSGG